MLNAILLLLCASVLSAADNIAASMNKKIDPCVDFHQYACGAWMATHPIPADRARFGRFDELTEHNEAVLLDLLQGAAVKRAGGSEIDQKIGDAFTACMDTAAIEKRGIAPLRPELDRIRDLTGRGVMTQIGHLHSMGVSAVFFFGASPDYKDSTRTIANIGPGGLSLPDREYYLKTDPKSVETRRKFEAHLVRMFSLLGESAEAAASDARAVIAFETILAKAAPDRVFLRNPDNRYHLMKRAELQDLTPGTRWNDFLKELAAPAFDVINVVSPDYLRKIAADLNSVPMTDWKAYFTYQLVHFWATELPAAFDQETFDFYEHTMRGVEQQRPRAKRCVSAVDRRLGDLLGRKYVEQAFGASSREQIAQMVAALEKALERDILSLPWMSAETKPAAIAKLHAITNNVGTPKKWRDYHDVTIAPDDYLGNTMRAAAAAHRRNLEKIGKPTDRSEWVMSTPTVNAFYSPQNNSINFPAGILQPPFFDATRDVALNYGAIGAVIGHELTHGFDDSGRKFDGAGNLRDWWTAQDRQEFEKRVACIADEYSNFTAVEDVKLNGRLTLGENTADSGGLRIALMALQDTLGGKSAKVDGYTPEQRFFLGFAQVWCQNARPEQARVRAMTDPHSPGKYRVNGTLQNMPEFQKAFSCQAGQPMVSANACRVW